MRGAGLDAGQCLRGGVGAELRVRRRAPRDRRKSRGGKKSASGSDVVPHTRSSVVRASFLGPLREVTSFCTPRRPSPTVWYQSCRQDGEAQVQRTEHYQPL